MLYRYVRAKNKYYARPFFLRYLHIVFLAIGIFFVSLVVEPIIAYNLNLQKWEDITVEANSIVSPVSDKVEVIQKVDYNLIANWFPSSPIIDPPSKISHYTISIPRLKIEKAIVAIGGDDLSKSLIQYPGTALPGQWGNVVIFGHSILPSFYDPKNYKSIFSLIPTLEQGDEIFIDYDGMSFTYEVVDYLEKKPDEIDILQQRFDRQWMSLITCVPPGTYLRRGVIIAKLK